MALLAAGSPLLKAFGARAEAAQLTDVTPVNGPSLAEAPGFERRL